MTSQYGTKSIVPKTFNAASATDLEVWNPATGHSVVLMGFIVKCESAADLDIYVGTDAAGKQIVKGLNVAAGQFVGPFWFPPDNPYKGGADESVFVTASAGAVSGAFYGVERRP